jgi:ABC-type arginine transport system permease subunit
LRVFLRFFFSPSAGAAALDVFLPAFFSVVFDGALEAVAGALEAVEAGALPAVDAGLGAIEYV